MEQEISKMNDLGKKLLDDMNLIKGSLCELEKNCFKTKSIDRWIIFYRYDWIWRKEHKSGYKERIKGLEIMRDQAKQLNDILKTNDVSALFPTYSETINELKEKNLNCSFIFRIMKCNI